MRDLKSAKAAKGDIDVAVKELLELKAQFKTETGIKIDIYIYIYI